MNLGKIIIDYIDIVYPKHADANAEVYSDAMRSIRFLASRDWKEYEDRQREKNPTRNETGGRQAVSAWPAVAKIKKPRRAGRRGDGAEEGY